MQKPLLSNKQIEFIKYSTKKWNLAHGPVRSGKTVGVTFRFLQAAHDCPDSKIYIVGHTFDTAYRNVVRLIFDSPALAPFRPFCTWSGKKLYFKDKMITVLGAKDEGAIGNFQGDTYSLVYCNEMTLYPESIIQMIDTRLSLPHSMGFADMNPTFPSHEIKKWIDRANENDKHYYALQIMLEDNPYVDEDYKHRIKNSLSGVFYKRNYLGLWCMAEGAIFDFFDKSIHVVKRPPCAAEYYIAAIDYGTSNAFACVLVGVNTGRFTQTGTQLWVENEFYWNPKETGRSKVNSEFAQDIEIFLEPYGVKHLYVDPSAAAFKLELQRRGMHIVDANNDVFNGIQIMSSDLRNGRVVIHERCKNLIREIESYVWDTKKTERGEDAPIKRNDHAIDSLRYCLASHKVPKFQDTQTLNNQDYLSNRFNPSVRKF